MKKKTNDTIITKVKGSALQKISRNIIIDILQTNSIGMNSLAFLLGEKPQHTGLCFREKRALGAKKVSIIKKYMSENITGITLKISFAGEKELDLLKYFWENKLDNKKIVTCKTSHLVSGELPRFEKRYFLKDARGYKEFLETKQTI